MHQEFVRLIYFLWGANNECQHKEIMNTNQKIAHNSTHDLIMRAKALKTLSGKKDMSVLWRKGNNNGKARRNIFTSKSKKNEEDMEVGSNTDDVYDESHEFYTVSFG